MSNYVTNPIHSIRASWQGDETIRLQHMSSGEKFDVDIAGLFPGFEGRNRTLVARPVVRQLPDLPEYTVVEGAPTTNVYTKVIGRWYRHNGGAVSFMTDDALFENFPEGRVIMRSPGMRAGSEPWKYTREGALETLGLRAPE